MKISELIDEKEVLERLRGGDERAFEKIYNHYSNPLFWKLKQMLKDQEEAEEILQELFVRIWERRIQINPEQRFINYLYSIARHMVGDYFKKLAQIKCAYQYLQDNTSELVFNTEETLDNEETKALLEEAMEKLPSQRKMAFQLCKIEGKTHKEASVIMNISPNTVNNHLVKAIQSVKRHLEESRNKIYPIILLHIISQL